MEVRRLTLSVYGLIIKIGYQHHVGSCLIGKVETLE